MGCLELGGLGTKHGRLVIIGSKTKNRYRHTFRNRVFVFENAYLLVMLFIGLGTLHLRNEVRYTNIILRCNDVK